ncbi:O-antigen ligase family protein [Pasteurella canis]|uniref:O-antigen ligase family protein n=1 Tax=Pasteurella canis TaxID=753 RepID=UPI001CC62519|nr:O-antigen ligase family protein [Pasteurella canis]UAY77654.1 O-antigen ligase family protein [Pasteurella canis]
MILTKKKTILLFVNFGVSLFFLFILSVKGGHNIAPTFFIIIGLIYFITFFLRKKIWVISASDKALMLSYIVYFSLFLLSFIVHDGRLRELDNPVRVLLFLPLLLLFSHYPVNFKTIILSIPAGAAIAGLVAFYDSFILKSAAAYSPRLLQIQGGDIAMSLSMFSLVTSLYFWAHKKYFVMLLSLFAMLAAILGSFLSTARGGWIGLPIVIPLILYCFRQSLSTKFIVSFIATVLIAIVSVAMLPQLKVMQRVYEAEEEITAYFVENNSSTSVGARFDMWKNALLMAKEKPILGWGSEGTNTERKKQVELGVISSFAGQFEHAHNQYLDDLSKRGSLGLLSLLCIFLVPLYHFVQHLKTAFLEQKTIALLGIVHIISTMFYCISQSFFTHNSGNVFYFFLILIFYGALKAFEVKQIEK